MTNPATSYKEALSELNQMDGFIGAALVDGSSGLCLGSVVSRAVPFDIELAAAGNAQVVQTKKKLQAQLKIHSNIEDILISLEDQYHLIRMLHSRNDMFLYVVLDRKGTNLGMAKAVLQQVEEKLVF